ncbi:MAG: TIGR02117 family protein [Bacteroidetes bacterium]|jgi:uncharacterized protein (TIGR02117 family)|nr:TIGR02117 family protein [Bacteroidota bacterium]
MTLLLILGCLLVGFLAFVLLYSLAGLLCFTIPANRQYQNIRRDIEIYVVSNGVHVDYVLPSISPYFNWNKVLDDRHYETPLTEQTYLGIGWGDRGFYLEVDEWKNLKPSVAARAMLIPTPTLMHITAHPELPMGQKRLASIHLSAEQYLQLCDYICSYFREEAGQAIHLPGKGYTVNDSFYEAKGAYHAFNTCNFWINRGLIKIGVRAPIWSHGGGGIFYQLKKALPQPVAEPQQL